MSQDTTVSFSLEVNVGIAEDEVRKLQTVLFRTLSIIRRLTGNEDLEQAITLMQRVIQVTNQLRLALLALQAARMGAGDPVAWALAGVAVAEVGMSMSDTVGSYG